jgi:hypothetical protein
MRRTVTQLADSLGIDKAAVHRHLKTLEEGGFVKRYEDHGFVYYGLSWKARDLISPGENTRVVILLSASLLLLLCAAVFSVAALQGDVGSIVPRSPGSATDGEYSSEEASAMGVSFIMVGAGTVALVVLGAYAMLQSWRRVRKPKQRTVPELDSPDKA